MRKLSILAIALLLTCLSGQALRAQGPPPGRPPQPPEAPRGPSVPAPPRDLSGTWQPLRVIDGIQPNGARDMVADGRHEPPYTAAGLAAFKLHKPANGTTVVGPGEEHDPGHRCEPLGFPRADLFEIRLTQIVQTPAQILILYNYNRFWRGIWSDGRELPKDPDPRWFGYSSGKWTDDYTFVAQTNGIDDRPWLDNSGRPQSDEIKVEEVFHRVNRDALELSVTIDDPKYYSKPWVAMNKMPFRLVPPTTEPIEMMCSPGEFEAYNKKHADPGSKKK